MIIPGCWPSPIETFSSIGGQAPTESFRPILLELLSLLNFCFIWLASDHGGHILDLVLLFHDLLLSGFYIVWNALDGCCMAFWCLFSHSFYNSCAAYHLWNFSSMFLCRWHFIYISLYILFIFAHNYKRTQKYEWILYRLLKLVVRHLNYPGEWQSTSNGWYDNQNLVKS